MSKLNPGLRLGGGSAPSPDTSGVKPFSGSTEPRLDASAWIVQSARPSALREVITTWDVERQLQLFRVLLPIARLVQFGVDPVTLTDASGRPVTRVVFDASLAGVCIELYHSGDAVDAMMEFELRDTPFNQIEVVWLTIQDPIAPRFSIDVMPNGETTLRGTTRRNLPAEADALSHGLAPGQVRRGLEEFDKAVERMETFMLCLGQRDYVAQPLYYHTAVLFERAGFSYLQGQARMERIDAGFAVAGDLRARLDGSSPFRQRELADTVRGRAWAIHDGILDEQWDRVRMVKRLGVHAQINTCPGVPW
jgi:hypothetical protein